MRTYFRGRSLAYVLRFVLAAPLALIIWLGIEIINIFRPVFIVGLSYKGRITHYMQPMELHLRQANISQKKYLMIFVMPAATPNEAVRAIYCRYSTIIDSHFPQLFRSAFGIVSEILKHRFTPELLAHHLLWPLAPATTLNKAEDGFGKDLMRQLGIPDGAEYVCLGVKEAAYYASINPDGGYGQDLRHQAIDSRNVNIANYMLAATHLAELGIYVVRIGSVVSAPLPKDRHPLIIDYATEARSELGDVVLGANCKFLICGATGSFIFAASYNRPRVYLDQYDFALTAGMWHDQAIMITRLYRTKKEEFLPFKSVIEYGETLCTDSELHILNIQPIPNSPEDILDAVSELNLRINNFLTYSNENDLLQDKFYSCFDPPIRWRELSITRISTNFLRKYQDLL